jgi:hypothetical protein
MGLRPFSRIWLSLLALAALSTAAWAIDSPLRDPSGLLRATQEQTVQVTTARVVLADYDLLKKDFPDLRGLSNLEIDGWILSNTAFISKPQATQEVVNTRVSTSALERAAFRPKDYGRALVFKVGDSGLIDAKGAGAVYPLASDHSNGLASLGEAIREFAYENLVNKIFTHSQSEYKTVRNYAVIDLGFDIKNADGSTSPAGTVLRQAHERSLGSYSLIDTDRALKIEQLLRRYGVTSAGAHRNRWPYEWLNIQGTKNGDVLDFGGFLTVDRFEKPLVEAFKTLTYSPPLMSIKEVSLLQPDPAIRVPLDLWGTTFSGKVDPAYDNPWIWSHELAANLRAGTASRADVEQHIRNLLEPVALRFSNSSFMANASAATAACLTETIRSEIVHRVRKSRIR